MGEIAFAVSGLFGVLVLLGGWIVGMALLRGWVLTLLWSWFVVPLFHLPEMNIAQAIGIALLVSFFMPLVPAEKDAPWRPIILATLSPLITLGVAYVVKGYL